MVAGTSGGTAPIPIRLRGARSGSLRLALVTLAFCSVLITVMQVAVAAGTPELLMVTLLFSGVALIWATAGIIAWWRRPGNAMGALIYLGALSLFLNALGNLPDEFLQIIGAVSATLTLAVTVHLLHAFPSGRLRGRLSVATVVVGYVLSVLLQGARVVFVTVGQTQLDEIAAATQSVVGIGVMVSTAVILTRRLLRADAVHRRVLLPLFLYGILAVLAIVAAPNIGRPLGVDPLVVGIVQLGISCGIPIAFLIGVLNGGFTRTGDLEALSAWLGIGGVTRPAVGRALAGTLGDESLLIVYWSPEKAAYVDEFGADVDATRDDPDRDWVQVHVGERLVGAIVYDTRMIGDPYPVNRAAEVLAIAIDRERLTAELIASNEELSESRVRIVETADRERYRIAQDLHDGLQMQLVLLALDAQNIATRPEADPGSAAAAAELRRRIDGAAADLRRLVHNVLPAALVETGLAVATEDLVDRLSIPATLRTELGDSPLPAPITHTAYFIIAEVLTNAVKHSRAESVHVSIVQTPTELHLDVADDGVGGATTAHGSGLLGVTDRIDVLGGHFQIDSPKGAGTRVKVVLPCAS
ncbi:Signal transduction histidine-protein kinase/phosphatase DegS [Microbacterium lemovicicum]|uniref:histidine kinase n=1 Tax=Microbacterium lemovicicum TaxID=1072463 RepID=A0A3Q9IYZ1_9MICO|nr:histidine kinase [Microbacterium lemovicicum]AZS37450.1 Signal transduction histidine-protein kinase/phosphatase DegS [Microbacterium lemovicicum]